MASIRQMFNRRAICMVLALVFTFSLFSFAASERRIKNKVNPAYPEMAKRNGLSGTVKLEVLVAGDGSVRNIKVVGGHPVLAEAAVSAVKQWRYESGPESTQIVDVKFNLQ